MNHCLVNSFSSLQSGRTVRCVLDLTPPSLYREGLVSWLFHGTRCTTSSHFWKCQSCIFPPPTNICDMHSGQLRKIQCCLRLIGKHGAIPPPIRSFVPFSWIPIYGNYLETALWLENAVSGSTLAYWCLRQNTFSLHIAILGTTAQKSVPRSSMGLISQQVDNRIAALIMYMHQKKHL